MSIKDHYRGVIREIMSERNLQPLQRHQSPSPLVRPHADFDEVLLHTDWFVNTGDSRAHYRYRRYLELLGGLPTSSRNSKIVHFDIGCGAGLFSWAFLDWATAGEVGFDRVALFGLDHSPAMIQLAEEVRDRLTGRISDYPVLQYSDDGDALLRELEQRRNQNTVCVITLGHVLAQTYTYTPDDIGSFAQIIARIRGWVRARRKCALVGADAQSASSPFLQAWDKLVDQLGSAGVSHDVWSVRQTAINDETRAKRAWLQPAA